jgi:hypothetical protein
MSRISPKVIFGSHVEPHHQKKCPDLALMPAGPKKSQLKDMGDHREQTAAFPVDVIVEAGVDAGSAVL